MADLVERFNKAAEEVKTLSAKPSNEDLLDLYAFYKQSVKGDATGPRPGMFDMVGRAKFDAWKKLDGLAKDQAMERYIARVEDLIKRG